MKRVFKIVVLSFFLFSCSEDHFIKDSALRDKVESKFNERKELAKNRSDKLFKIFDSELTLQETEALKFLYAYMPLCDLADYDEEFFIKQIKSSFEARDYFNWGRKIPDNIFRHFVLPYRVNNENLDSARWVFLSELKERIKDLSMHDAVLEVNHWCHEKVNYHPADIRTSSPLATVTTSWGRCGEESTFTVTALRAVGIPARQVYTPRWAHVDNNHAWVEVWVDGKWYYFGACEPEPKLNMGWFSEPSRRAMLVHTKAIGEYAGNEKVLQKNKNYTELNVLENYTDVKEIFIKTVDKNNKPIEGATVYYGLYNYAEFYPLKTGQTNKNGISSFTTGYGDLFIEASTKSLYGSKMIRVDSVDTVAIILDNELPSNKTDYFDLVPPIEKVPLKIAQSDKVKNDKRLAAEDKIREKYKSTFIDSSRASILANKLSANEKLVWKYISLSYGNWQEIKKVLHAVPPAQYDNLFEFFEQISKKDLRDATSETLLDHFTNTFELFNINDYSSKQIFYSYILNPRIKNEMLVPYRLYFWENYKNLLNTDRKKSAMAIKSWISANIKINNDDNYYDLPITPIGVHELKISNEESRDIFFVAVCRSIGIPARLEPETKIPQYYDGNIWNNVNFSEGQTAEFAIGYLSLTYKKFNQIIEPLYYIHFTLGKYQDGKYITLEYPWQKPISSFDKRLKLTEGKYRLITGNRSSDGSVLNSIIYFEILKNHTTEVELELRSSSSPPIVYGKINSDYELKTINGNRKLKSFMNTNTSLFCWIDPSKEPTKHFLGDLSKLKSEFERWGGNIIAIIPTSKDTEAKSSLKSFELPNNFNLLSDPENDFQKYIKYELKIDDGSNLPIIIGVNNKNQIIFYSIGYKIGIGEQLIKTVY